MAKAVFIFALLVLVSCSSRAGGSGEHSVPAPGPDLVTMGRIFLWVGGISIVVGIFAKVATLFASANPIIGLLNKVPGLTKLFSVLAEFGVISLLAGVAFMWLGSHLWVLVVSLLVAGALYLYYRRDAIVRLFNIKK